MILATICIAAAYQIVALIAALRHRKRRDRAGTPVPVSILKPVRGLDEAFYEAIASHAGQQHPDIELLFGVADLDDAAVPFIERLRREYPRTAIRLIHVPARAPNAKVAILMALAREARHPLLIVNDSDIRVTAEYARRVTAPLSDPRVGLVTCLYRPRGTGWPARLEALAISTGFAPSVLVAPLVGVNEFALGSTLAMRAADLERAGGFAAIAGYIADDYQLGKRIRALGLCIHLSTEVVETRMNERTWSGVWRHQVRWARTIRVSRPRSYPGLLVTNATLWALVAVAFGHAGWALALLLLRVLSGLATAVLVLRDFEALRFAWLIPASDAFGLAVWCAGAVGSRVSWRGRVMHLGKDGRIRID